VGHLELSGPPIKGPLLPEGANGADAGWRSAVMDSGLFRGALSAAVDIVPKDIVSLAVSLSNRLAFNETVRKRNKTLMGRIVSRLSGESADYIETPYGETRQILELLEIKGGDRLVVNTQYEVRRDQMALALDKLKRAYPGLLTNEALK
jgi:hypothetical protein